MQNHNADRAGPQGKEPQGDTRAAQGPAQQPQPRMQHERDESSDSQAADEPSQRRMGQIAHDDLEHGRVDTDKGPVLEETYDKLRAGPVSSQRKVKP